MSRWCFLIGFYIFVDVQLLLITGDELPITPISGLPENEEVTPTIMHTSPVLEDITDDFLLQNAPTNNEERDKLLMAWEIVDLIDMIHYATDDDPLPSNCDEALEDEETSGVHKLYIPGIGLPPFFAYCLKANNTNWMIIQRRMNGLVDFYRNWEYYKNGFGDLNGEYWLGLDLMNAITANQKHEIWFELQDHKGNRKYARYDQFLVGDESTKYTLQAVGNYAGNAGDSFRYQVGNHFSTKDVDNDSKPDGSCAQVCKGAWWFGNCRESHFNGLYKDKEGVFPWGIHWYSWLGRDYSLKYVHMAIRPIETETKTCK